MKNIFRLGSGFFIFLSLLYSSTFSQPVDATSLKGMKIRNIGPAGMSGRVTTIDVVLSNPDIIYVGTASGGLWKSESGGIEWKAIFDKQPVQSIGAVAVCQSNPAIVWAGTGEGNPRNSQSSGAGIFKSLDGGRTWKCMGLEDTKTIHRIIIHSEDPNTVYVGAQGSAWGPNKERGIFRTTDGGKSWEKVLYINESTGCADLITDPSNPNKLIAAMWEFGRTPWDFNSGGEGSGLYISYDGGSNWKQKTDKHGLPKGNWGRIGLGICHDRPNVVYALVEAKTNALYRSDDGGESWKLRADKNIGNRPFYYADIYVDPQNENRIYNLHSTVTLSEDGGKTFRNLVGWAQAHPDHHAFWVHPEDPDFLIDGNDGGMSISRDRGETWRFVENLPIGQFYHINYDLETPYNVYGGMQDNGSWVGPGRVWRSGGIRNSYWTELSFGDGFDVVPQPNNTRFGYSMWQGGNVVRYDRKTGETKYIQPNHPEGEFLRFNWNAGIAADPANDCGIFLGSQYLHHSEDCGETWRIISPDLTTNDTTRQQQHKSGGLTIDATKAENHTTIIAIAPSAVNQQIIWVGTDDGNLQLTTDGGENWTNVVSRLPGAPKGCWIPQIEVSRHNANEAFVVVNHYRRNDWKPYVYHTADLGKSFTRLVDEKDVSGHALSIVQDIEEPNLLFLGTENGLYFSIDKGKNWNKWENGYPSVSTMDLKIHPREADLIIGTFGRAAWILDDIRPLRALAREGKSLLDKDFVAFDAGTAVMASWRQPDGLRFGGTAHFEGQNEPRGARIMLWVKDPKADKTDKKESEEGDDEEEETDEQTGDDEKPNDESSTTPEKPEDYNQIRIWITDASGDTVRYWTVKPDTGLNRIHWNMRADGVHMPQWGKIKEDKPKPAGRRVVPGKYDVHLRLRDHEARTQVTLLPDPRTDYHPEALAKQAEWMDKIEAIIREATAAFEQLKTARETLDRIAGLVKDADKEVRSSIAEAAMPVKKDLSRLEKLFMTPKDFKGLEHYSLRLNDYLGRARDFIQDADGEPAGNARLAYEKAKSETDRVVEQVKAFTNGSWRNYVEEVKGAEISIIE